MNSSVDRTRYVVLLQAVASMSKLFSDNSVPYVDSRFVERLFVQATGARDLSGSHKSFDALLDQNIGVGIKTFLSGTGLSKREKVAEFPRLAQEGKFEGLHPRELAEKVSSYRNSRVRSDANELGIDLAKSIYHCLVRTPLGAIIHEEPYSLVDVDNIRPTDRRGRVVSKWEKSVRGAFFTDGISNYNFNASKNVLIKQFKFSRNRDVIELPVFEDIFERVVDWFELEKSALSIGISDDSGKGLMRLDKNEAGKPGIDFIVLPLYSTRGKEKAVAQKSGINQWNAGGRRRVFGEAYVPVPSEIHKLFPKFFPKRDVDFQMFLPNDQIQVPGKICQDGGKALMSTPNVTLGHWILKVIDPTLQEVDFQREPRRRNPFSYSDLLSIGKDAVSVRRVKGKMGVSYHLEFAPLDSYEDFIALAKS